MRPSHGQLRLACFIVYVRVKDRLCQHSFRERGAGPRKPLWPTHRDHNTVAHRCKARHKLSSDSVSWHLRRQRGVWKGVLALISGGAGRAERSWAGFAWPFGVVPGGFFAGRARGSICSGRERRRHGAHGLRSVAEGRGGAAGTQPGAAEGQAGGELLWGKSQAARRGSNQAARRGSSQAAGCVPKAAIPRRICLATAMSVKRPRRGCFMFRR